MTMRARADGAAGAGRRLEDFLGRWTLLRDIRHADGGTARFEGTADWRRAAAGARCTEEGWLILPDGTRLQAGRVYLWDADLSVRFDDGRFFHAVPAGGGAARHWCAPDLYEARYDFTGWPDWSCTWRVRGPRKDYRMLSGYRRAAA